MELERQPRRSSQSRLTVHVNKIHSVRTLELVARDLGEDVDWLADIATDMDPEDGLIWVYGLQNEDGTMAFSEFGVESLRNLIGIHRNATK